MKISKAIINPGDRFGRLVAIEPTGEYRNRCPMRRCKCDCGRETCVRSISLYSGNTRSCGCLRFGRKKHSPSGVQITPGDRFGRLVALEQTGEYRSGYPMWRCKCDCGQEVCVRAVSLSNGQTRSCGCLRSLQNNRHPSSVEIGQRFGLLVVTGFAKRNHVICRCDCGNNKILPITKLHNGWMLSCGCLQHTQRHKELCKPCTDTHRSISSNNTTGVRGVSRLGKKYLAGITNKHKYYYLGLHDTLEEAAEARKRAEYKLLESDKPPLT